MKILFYEAYRSPIDQDFDFTRVTIYETEKLKDLSESEYSYVRQIVEAAEAGKKTFSTSRKFSFSDCSNWYESAECDINTDYEHVIDVELV